MQNRKRDTDVQNKSFGLCGRRRGWDVSREQHIYYLGWNRSPAQVRCLRQVLRAGALGRPRGMGWRGRWEGGSGWGIHVNPWLIHVNVWQKPLQYCKVISLQLIKINEKKNLNDWDFPGGPVVKNPPYYAENVGLITGWGSKISHALGQWRPCATTRVKPGHWDKDPVCLN